MQNTKQEWLGLPPGSRAQVWWETGLTDAPRVPVLALRGLHDGPFTLVTGGVHGDEYEGPAAIQKVFRDADADMVCGLLVGVPVLNVAAYRSRSRTTPSDGIDLNRVFPGHGERAKRTEQLAHSLFETFVQSCDVLLDLHSGGLRLNHLPLAGWYGNDEGAEAIARRAGPQFYPWKPAERPGVLSYEAFRIGKTAVGMEWGGGARLDQEGMLAYANVICQVLQGTGMAGSGQVDGRDPVTGDYLPALASGLFFADVALGERVTTGQSLGVLYDELGHRTAVVTAPHAGLVAGLAHLALVETGDRIAYIG